MFKIIINILIAGLAGQLGLGQASGDEIGGLEPKVLGVEKASSSVIFESSLHSVGPERIIGRSEGLVLTAKSAVIIDRESGEVLFEKEPDLKLPVASISKLATALVFLDTNLDWEKTAMMTGGDEVGGARLKILTGESLRIKDLFYASLIGSANNGIEALVRSTGMNDREFMVLMNKKVRELGMNEAYFAEPTGLNMVNHATAWEIAKLMRGALAKKEIASALALEEYSFQTINTKRQIKVINTDKLLSSFLNNGDGYKILGGKTGFTEEAGNCLALGVRDKEEHEIIAVILGATTSAVRFQEMKGMVWWVFENWEW